MLQLAVKARRLPGLARSAAAGRNWGRRRDRATSAGGRVHCATRRRGGGQSLADIRYAAHRDFKSDSRQFREVPGSVIPVLGRAEFNNFFPEAYRRLSLMVFSLLSDIRFM